MRHSPRRISDRADLLAQSRAETVADARRAAGQLAAAAGARVGPVISIADQSGGGPGVPVGRAEAADAAQVPVVPGEQELLAIVQVSFELLPGHARASGPRP